MEGLIGWQMNPQPNPHRIWTWDWSPSANWVDKRIDRESWLAVLVTNLGLLEKIWLILLLPWGSDLVSFTSCFQPSFHYGRKHQLPFDLWIEKENTWKMRGIARICIKLWKQILELFFPCISFSRTDSIIVNCGWPNSDPDRSNILIKSSLVLAVFATVHLLRDKHIASNTRNRRRREIQLRNVGFPSYNFKSTSHTTTLSRRYSLIFMMISQHWRCLYEAHPIIIKYTTKKNWYQ